MSAAPKILVVDIGGTHVKTLVSGHAVKRQVPSGLTMTPRRMVQAVKRLAADWKYDVVSIGFPGPVVHGRIVAEPANLASGWIAYDFAQAFGRPVKILNDAAMQALGSYRGGTLLFLGFGTGLGTALVVDGVVEPMELAHLPYRKGRSYEDYVGLRGLRRLGKKRWRKHVLLVIDRLRTALAADDLVLGGGNAKFLKRLPPGARLGDNANAFKGGFHLWDQPPAGRAPRRAGARPG